MGGTLCGPSLFVPMIHRFELDGVRFVLDVDSGCIHVVDELIDAIVARKTTMSDRAIVDELTRSYPEADVRDALDEVNALIDAGQLFSEHDFRPLAQSKLAQGDVIKALCLNVAHTCNLNCEYCFAAQGTYKGDQALMSLATGQRAIDFLIEHSGDRKHLEVDFFGGEPLLNWPMVKATVAYARRQEKDHDKVFRFTLTTNGVLIDDDVIAFANREMDNVVLSLDGRPEVHDRFRTHLSGRGSYDEIVPKFQKLVQNRHRGTYYMRGTFTHANPDFVEDILHIHDLGFDEISMEPVVCAPDSPYALTDEDVAAVKTGYERLAREIVRAEREGHPFRFYHFMINLEGGPCIYKRVAGCGSGTEYLAVTPNGDLYPCHQLVEHPEFKMGNVWTGLERDDIVEQFSKRNIFSLDDCHDCWAKYYCSGGCAANAFHVHGRLDSVDETSCELFRKRIECALRAKVGALLDI
jgi:uncharacterized protein